VPKEKPMKPGSPGKPDCPLCQGSGSFRVVREPREGEREAPPSYRVCRCTLEGAILANAERGFHGLTKAPVIKQSPLLGREGNDEWITASKITFLAHLRHVAIRKSPSWGFKVVSDSQLMTAWLATASLKGAEIFDADAVSISLTHATLVDLVEPPELLVIWLGIKLARNEAMPEVLLETLTHRGFCGKPTWLWDQPDTPLSEGHRCYSPMVEDYLSDWHHIRFKRRMTARDPSPNSASSSASSEEEGTPTSGGRPTLSGLTPTE